MDLPFDFYKRFCLLFPSIYATMKQMCTDGGCIWKKRESIEDYRLV